MESEFSNDGSFYSVLNSDGKLKIWETSTNNLKHEFTPSLHLNQPCTCLKWVQISTNQSPWKKRKRLDSRENVPASQCIALGTRAGSVLVYSPSESNILTTLGGVDGVSAAGITCMTWASHSGLITCAGYHFTRWNIADGAIKTKWKDPKSEISTSCLVIDSKPLLLTCARKMYLWNFEKKQLLQTFDGHASDIDILYYVPITSSSDGYFLSGAKTDRYLSCWNLCESSKKSNKAAVAKFVMEDAASHVSVVASEDGSVYMAVTVRSGVVHLFKTTLNGTCTKPLKPKVTIQVATSDASKNKNIVPIPILTAYLKEDCTTAIIGYGAPHALVFELVTISSFEKLQCLVRDDPRKLKAADSTSVSKIKSGNSNSVDYLSPANAIRTQPGKRKNKEETTFEVPMEQRLENLVLSKPGEGAPKSDNVANLLLQGLHSKDKNILQTVFSTKDENVIRNTVKRLPVQVLPVLIKELTGLIQGKTTWSHNGALWLKQVVHIHASQLLSNPELNELINPTLGLVQNRLTLLPSLCLLRGRLDLLVGQITTSTQTEDDEIVQSALIYHDDSSESSSDEMENFDNQSESDEQWDEDMMSDAEMSN